MAASKADAALVKEQKYFMSQQIYVLSGTKGTGRHKTDISTDSDFICFHS